MSQEPKTPTELHDYIKRLEWDKKLLQDRLDNYPTPHNNDAVRDLADWAQKWRKTHHLQSDEEIFLLASYLAGRQSVQVALRKIKEQPATHPEEEGWPEPKPRRPYNDDIPHGYEESDQEFLRNNIELAVLLLERHIQTQPKETSRDASGTGGGTESEDG